MSAARRQAFCQPASTDDATHAECTLSKEKEKAARRTGFALQRTFAGTNVIYEPCYAGRGREAWEGREIADSWPPPPRAAQTDSLGSFRPFLTHLVMRLVKRGPRHISRSCRLLDECVGDRAKK